MKKFLAAIAAALAINAFAGVQVTKQYCDNNSERAVSNSYQLVKVEAAKLPGIASNVTARITSQIITNKVDEVMRSESAKIIITNTVHNTIMNEPVVSNAVFAAAHDAAGRYTDQASNYANIASTYAAASSTSSGEARTYAVNALNSATQAGNSEQSARSWAETSHSYSDSSRSAYNDIVVFTNWFEVNKGQVVTNIIHYVPAEDYSHPYTEPISGIVHDNLRIFDRSIYGALRAYPIIDDPRPGILDPVIHYACLRYKVSFSTTGSSTSTKVVYLDQAYIDTDSKGIRIHYLPIDKTRPSGLTGDTGKYYLIRDFYWQNDGIYVVVDSHGNDGLYYGRITVVSYDKKGTEYITYKLEHVFPNYYSGYSTLRAVISRTGSIMSNYNGVYVGCESSSSTTNGVWMKSEMSDDQRDIYNWIRSFPGPQ